MYYFRLEDAIFQGSSWFSHRTLSASFLLSVLAI